MLDAETKRKIDSLRDILVGIIPNPQTQIDHITTGLIYKFIYDMDQESISMGGKASFFTDDYDRYSWDKLFDSKLGGSELTKLYRDAVESFYLNPNAPELFRDLFKNASSPTTNAPVLKMFLKEINEFEYSNSELLGNAFEYLLSFMGSQGDAGQFRTPRHIIDFIVEIIDPQKHEKILDPACGTAGFLISSYKHVLKNKLSAIEKKKVTENINGYDITPEMVRLSQVNMYLHNFVNPKIYEYDTLSSEDRWHEYFDVILANPPFMTPKGGIQPHNKFGIGSNRAEVLFTDYILEHLKPGGRAGIVIPEGIVSTIQNAYVELRRQLVNNGLVGIISLPAGVFKPYSGVKTNILILDKKIYKNIDSIFYVEIKNDGFDLGDQRKQISQNDLPEAIKHIKKYLKDFETTNLIKKVKKELILQSSTVSLNLQKYFSDEVLNSKYQYKKLADICEIYQPKTITQDDLIENGAYIVYGANGIIGRYDKFNHEESEVLITCRGATCGRVNLSQPFSWITGNAMVVKPKDESILKKYLYHIFKYFDFSGVITGAAQPQITRTNLEVVNIPVPPISYQKEFIEVLDGYENIINGCYQIIKNYKPIFSIDPTWSNFQIKEVAEIISGQSPDGKFYNQNNDGLPFYQGCTDFGDIYLKNTKNFTSHITKRSNIGDIVMSVRAPVGPVNLTPFEICIGRGLCAIRPNEKINLMYLFNLLMSKNYFKGSMGAVYESINKEDILNTKIPVPPLEVQIEIVNEINVQRNCVDSTWNLLKIYENKVKNLIEDVLGLNSNN